jgi:hypothetical protein
MNRAFLLGLGILLCAVAWLWWSDPSKKLLDEIVAEYQAPEQAPSPPAVAQPTSDESEASTPDRVELESLAPLPAPQSEPVSSVHGRITGGSEVFPNGDRSGVQVYCWPGWYAQQPHRLESLADAPGIQVTTTDAAGNFNFELYVDDAHWLFALADGMCSDPEGMRIGTKPGVELSMEMRRLLGLRYHVIMDGREKEEINFYDGMSYKLIGASGSERMSGRRFPRAFFPSVFGGLSKNLSLMHGEILAWLEPATPLPVSVHFQTSLPGCIALDETIPLAPVLQAQALPDAELRVDPQAEFGQILLELTGVPDAARAPFCGSLYFPLTSLSGHGRVEKLFEDFGQFPFRLNHVPEGDYRITPQDHPQAIIDLGLPEFVQVRAGKTTHLILDYSSVEFLVFERDPELKDVRYLTLPRVRIRGRGEAGLSDWKEPRQLVILKPLTDKEEMIITGSVFLDGPRGPRKQGRVTTYTAGIDDD